MDETNGEKASLAGSESSIKKDNDKAPKAGETQYSELIQDESFYGLCNLKDFRARKTENGDIIQIKRLLSHDDYDFFAFNDVVSLLEKCCFSLVLAECVELDRIVAAAFFDDSPMDSRINIESKMFKEHPNLRNLNKFNTFFLRLYVSTPEVPYDLCLTEILTNTFMSCPRLEYIVVEMPVKSEELDFHPVVKEVHLKLEDHGRKNLLIYDKSLMFPPLEIREGREQDVDEFGGLISMDRATMVNQFGKTTLGDIVSTSDKTEISYVAQWHFEARGVINTTAEIDYKLLNKHFHLECYNGLYKPHRNDAISIVHDLMMMRKEPLDFSTVLAEFKPTASGGDEVLYLVEEDRETQKEVVEQQHQEIEETTDSDVSDRSSEFALHHLFGRRVSKDIVKYGLKPDSHDCSETLKIAGKVAGEVVIEENVPHVFRSSPKSPNAKKDTPVDIEEKLNSQYGDMAKRKWKLPVLKTHLLANEDVHDYSDLGKEIINFLGLPKEVTVKRASSAKIMPTYQKKNPNLGSSSVQKNIQTRRDFIDEDHFLPEATLTELFETKIIVKRIREIFIAMKDRGASWESNSKEIAAAKEFERLRFVGSMTKEAFLAFLDLITPSENLYPLKRSVRMKESKFFGIPNAIAIQLFAMKHKFKIRLDDMLRAVFQKFPNKEYLVISIPVGTLEPEWLNRFVRAVPKMRSCYPMELFLLHKLSLKASLTVKKATTSDLHMISEFLQGVTDKSKILDDFHIPDMETFIAENEDGNQKFIVGVAVVSHEKEPLAYQVNFELDSSTYSLLLDEHAHGYMHHFVMSPVFLPHEKFFMREIMTKTNKKIYYHRIFPLNHRNKYTDHQSKPTNLENWIPIAPKKKIDYDQLNLVKDLDEERRPSKGAENDGDPYSLIMTTRRLVMDSKITVNFRVVVVGASETGLACLERLIISTYKCFKKITLIDTAGLPGSTIDSKTYAKFFPLRKGGKAASYPSLVDYVQRLGLNNWINLCSGNVTKIDRDSRYVVVNGVSTIPYDLLILTPGRQFMRPDCANPEINNPAFQLFKEKTTGLGGKSNKIYFNKEKPKPKNVFLMNNELDISMMFDFIKLYSVVLGGKKIVIFGACFESYGCIEGLINYGIKPQKIVLVATPEKEMAWEREFGFKNLDKIKDAMKLAIRKFGVHVLENYEFMRWDLCPASGLAKRIHFLSESEKDAHISLDCFLFVPYRYKRVNDLIASAINEASIVFQDGIVIDEYFKTSDRFIMAGGPAAVYKKILIAEKRNHIYCESEEVGFSLGEAVLEALKIDLSGIIPTSSKSKKVKKFKKPYIRSCKLPDGWYYMAVKKPEAAKVCRPEFPCEEECDCSIEIVTGSTDVREDINQKYFKINLDEKCTVQQIECISKAPFSFSNIAGVYGHHEACLGRLLEGLEKGIITCLYEHFSQPWFSVFCLDEWRDFKEEMQDLYQHYNIGNGQKLLDFIRDFLISLENEDSLKVDPDMMRNVWECSGLKEIVELRLLNFLKFHHRVLPMYARHDYAESLLEERTASVLYQAVPPYYS